MAFSNSTVLRVAGQEVACYVWQPDLPLGSSPRPYLHPVRTLAGHTVTDAGPDSHPHQLGISVAVPDVDGRNFWGGRTFVAGHGPAWLDNHGIQQHQRWLRNTDTEHVHLLDWIAPHRPATLLRERRSITGRRLNETAWSLGIQTQLTNATDRPLALRSPVTAGRAGAGYGGIFWRGPAITGDVSVRSSLGSGVRSVHGRSAAWIAVTLSEAWTMLFVLAGEDAIRDRWFVRARDYLGVGLSLAWDQPLVLPPGATIDRHLRIAVIDGVVSQAAIHQLTAAARAAT